MTSLHIGVDIDDCLYPWYQTAHNLAVAAKITNGKEASTWAMYEDYGCTKEEWLKVCSDGAISGDLYDKPPFFGVKSALQRLENAGHVIHLVTARGFFAYGDLIRKHTIDWLYYNDIPHHSLTFVKDKTFAKVDVFVDDAPHNATALLEAGTPVWLLNQTHNLNSDFANRVESLDEFVDLVLNGTFDYLKD